MEYLSNYEKSKILSQNLGWKDVEVELPKENEEVVLRLCHIEKTRKVDNEILAVEDVKIGVYRNGNWFVAPPFPRFDFSPLSDHSKLKEKVIVTHWRVPEEAELTFWKERFDLIRSYENLSLDVDDKNARDVYRALIWGAALINQYAGEEDRYLADILCDLQHCMDVKENYNELDSR